LALRSIRPCAASYVCLGTGSFQFMFSWRDRVILVFCLVDLISGMEWMRVLNIVIQSNMWAHFPLSHIEVTIYSSTPRRLPAPIDGGRVGDLPPGGRVGDPMSGKATLGDLPCRKIPRLGTLGLAGKATPAPGRPRRRSLCRGHAGTFALGRSFVARTSVLRETHQDLHVEEVTCARNHRAGGATLGTSMPGRPLVCQKVHPHQGSPR
jgi:hypothetical protein